ncbi:glutathione S-transferase [Rhizoctonia solani]|uniref:Glutathione S-transferase n=1 Tax=Rhizoctonia solani TaxID=456999 RepID=A0A8H8SYK6_9AGAM|nr:glutathione S-transferase [Rhizoctonia solani]QRW23321.1 glutathione S-transferase [Rhizoctonia solani]
MSETTTRQRGVAEIARSQVRAAADVGQEAVSSGAYVYPVKGIYYLLAHPRLYKPIAKPLGLSFITNLGILAFLFTFTYLPQAAFMAIFSGPFGFITAIPLILGEAAAITTVIAKTFYLGPALENLFDETLLLQGQTKLVSNGREVTTQSGTKALGKLILKPLHRFSKEGIIRYILSIPLNFIPVVGTVFFLGYNGGLWEVEPNLRANEKVVFPQDQRKRWISERRGAYTSFGFAALALNLIPFATLVFSCTSAVGAALWAADEEKRQGSKPDMSAVPEQDKTRDGDVKGPQSPYVRKVVIAARLLGLNDRIERIVTKPSEVTPPQNLINTNPLGKVPALVVDSAGSKRAVFDSPVILQYFDTISEPRDRLYPPSSDPARIDTLNYEALTDGILDATYLIRAESIKQPEEQRSAQLIAAQRNKVRRGIEALGALPEPEFPSAKAVGLACTLWYLNRRLPDFNWREGQGGKKLEDWFKRAVEHPAWVEEGEVPPS